MDDLLGWMFWMIDLVCLMMLLMDVLFADGYLLQDALVLEFPGGPYVNEQRKDEHGKPKGGEADILGTPTAQPQRHSKHPGHRKTNQTKITTTHTL